MRTFHLYLQQFFQRLGGLAAWLVIWSALSCLFSYVFKSLATDNAATMQVFKQLPPQVMNAVNIDPIAYLSRVESFVSGQLLFVYLLAGSIFAISLGVGVIGRRIQNRTIANLLTRPIPRGHLYLSLLAANLSILALAGVIIASVQWLAFNAFSGQENISGAYFTYLHVGSTLIFMVMAALGQLLGTILNGGKAVPIGAGLVVISWFVDTLGAMADLPNWVLQLSVFHYFDVARLRDHFSLDPVRTLILVGILVVLAGIGTIIFKRKNIYL